MPLYSSRHAYLLFICLFLILFYCSTGKQSSWPLTTLWIPLYLHCLKNLHHTELAARLWGCFFTFFEIYLSGGRNQGCASQPPHNSDAPAMSPAVLWAAGGEGPLAMPGHLSALPHTGWAVLGMHKPLYRCTRGGLFSSNWARYQDCCNSGTYLPKYSGPGLLQLLCLCHLSYWDESFTPLLLCQLQSLNPCCRVDMLPALSHPVLICTQASTPRQEASVLQVSGSLLVPSSKPALEKRECLNQPKSKGKQLFPEWQNSIIFAFPFKVRILFWVIY